MSRAFPATKLRARRRRRRIALLVAAVALLFALCAGAVGLLWLPQVRITSIDVAGAESVAPEMIQQTAQEMLGGAYYYIFPRNSIFLYPKDAIRSELLSKFPVFSSVSVRANGFHALGIDVTERKPDSLWCGTSAAANAPCFLLDRSGAVYAPAADFSGDVYTQYFGATQQGTPQRFLTPEQFAALSALTDALKDRGTLGTVEWVEVNAEHTVRVRFTSGFELLFALSDSGADVLTRLDAALTADPFTTHAVSDFEYLDLRFGDKLYYKLRSAGEEPAATSTPAQ